VIYVITVSDSSLICYVAKIFTTVDSHSLQPHVKLVHTVILSLRVCSPYIKGECLCLIMWNAHNPFLAVMCLHSSVIACLVK
jgi:hypothetical protein